VSTPPKLQLGVWHTLPLPQYISRSLIQNAKSDIREESMMELIGLPVCHFIFTKKNIFVLSVNRTFTVNRKLLHGVHSHKTAQYKNYT